MRARYRAWDKKKKRMFDVVAINWDLERVYSTWDDEDGKNLYAPMSEVVLMQSISAPDDEGRDIYEGDVIFVYRKGYGDSEDEYQKYLVKWDYYYTGYSPFHGDYTYPREGFLVIGNIFEDDEYSSWQKEYFDTWNKEFSDKRRKKNNWQNLNQGER